MSACGDYRLSRVWGVQLVAVQRRGTGWRWGTVGGRAPGMHYTILVDDRSVGLCRNVVWGHAGA